MLLDPPCTARGADWVRAVSQIPGYTIGTPSMGAGMLLDPLCTARGADWVRAVSQIKLNGS